MTDVLYLLRETPSYEQIKSRIEAADLIYVGGLGFGIQSTAHIWIQKSARTPSKHWYKKAGH